MTKGILISILACFTFFIACKGQKPKEGYKSITLDTLKNDVIGKDVQLIDVRTNIEYKNGHIDDAINMNIVNSKKFKEQANQLNKNEPVYLYCKSGTRSYRASKLLQKLGFETVFDYAGGWSEWNANQP